MIVEKQVYIYSLLKVLAEMGGYIGLFLGISLYDVTSMTIKRVMKKAGNWIKLYSQSIYIFIINQYVI